MPKPTPSNELLDIGFETAVGRVREHNEDSLKIDRGVGLYAVADGMGGHNAGERASHLAVERLQTILQEAANGRPDGELLRSAFVDANQTILSEALEQSEKRGMGTTMTALLLRQPNYWIGHVGDSRAWLLRSGVCQQITLDHSVIGEQMRMGVITEDQAKSHPMRNVLTRSLGNMPEVEVDVLEGLPQPGDCWILGTDGMTAVLDAERIGQIVQESPTASEAAQRLVKIACDEDGSDNVTVVVVRRQDDQTSASNAPTVA